jgi:peptidoglycan/LPS O-acetylase OafA/YrhL
MSSDPIDKQLLNRFNTFFYQENIENREKKLNFLDGFRGTLALWVLIGHINSKFFGSDFYPFQFCGHYIGVNGFFILSSFLLTYRLLNELSSNSKSLDETIIIILKYSIRRIFRIYIPFVITVSLIKFNTKLFGGCFSYQSSWYDIITLKFPTGNHLWTIGPEIKYYAIIPVFCFTFSNSEKSKNYLIKFLNIFFFSVFIYFYVYYFFKNDLLYKYFFVFLNGSFLAVLFYKIQNISHIENKLKSEYFLLIAGFISMFMYMYGVILSSLPYNPKLSENRENYYLLTYKVSLWWTGVLFVMLIGSPNFFNNLFETIMLRTVGKFSFGIYLYHPMCIDLAQKYIKIKYGYEHYFNVIGLSFLVGFLFFYCVENKMIRKANDFCKKIDKWVPKIEF